jgi:transposase
MEQGGLHPMAMGRRPEQLQGELWIARDRVRAAPAHPFYQRLNQILSQADFDRFCEARCAGFYAQTLGRPSVPPGVYFRMLMVGYFEKLDSEREIAWRCDDSRALRAFLGYQPDQATPDHSSLSRTRQRIDLETHQAIFDWVLKRLSEQELLKAQTLGIDASTMEANAAMRSIVRKDNGQTHREFLQALAQVSGIATPTAVELARFDRQRKGKKCSNTQWHNPHDPDAKITRMKDGRTHLAYKPEHAVDLESGAIVAAQIHPGDAGDTTTLWGTLAQAGESLLEVSSDEATPAQAGDLQIREAVSDKGYHSAATLVTLEAVEIRGYLSEPDRGRQRWTARDPDEQAFKKAEQAAVYRNRRRLRGRRSKRLQRKRAELVERSFEHVLDDGGMRRAWLRGRANVAKRYLIHIAAFNLGLIMRKLIGFGTPKGWADARRGVLWLAARPWAALRRVWRVLDRLPALLPAARPNQAFLPHAA